ncbi:MAG: chorismate mutase [Candidatus Bathyarchaeia archaeon]
MRRKIDKIDEQIFLLLKRRIEISRKIGEIKRSKGLPIRDLEREEKKYKQITLKALELKIDPRYVKDVYRKIIDMSVHAQKQ